MKKPVVFIQGDKNFYRENVFAQNLLFKALSDGITDPQELRKVASLKSVADVYRTLDKMAIRREYHDALANAGISLSTIVEHLKSLGEDGSSDGIKLKAWQTILKSLGLDKYEKMQDSGKSWEETILLAIEAKKTLPAPAVVDVKEDEYEVIRPSMPESEKKKRAAEKSLSDEIYGTK